jgi:hypothetical protein
MSQALLAALDRADAADRAATEATVAVLATARQVLEALVCVECDDEITGEPVRDPEQVYWRGIENADVWCTPEHYQATAERRNTPN